MKQMPFNLQGKGVIPSPTSTSTTPQPQPSNTATTTTTTISSNKDKRKKVERSEPRSVLDQRRSPSPPTSSTSTLSSSSPAVASLIPKWSDWDLHPLPPDMTLKHSSCLSMDDDWDSMLSDHHHHHSPSSSSSSSFLKWIMADAQHNPHQQQHNFPIIDDELVVDASAIDPSLILETTTGSSVIGGVSDSIISTPLPCMDCNDSTTLDTNNIIASTGGFPLNINIYTPQPTSLPFSSPLLHIPNPTMFYNTNPNTTTTTNNNNSSSNDPPLFLPLPTFPNPPQQLHLVPSLQIQSQFYAKVKPEDPSVAHHAVVDQLVKAAELIEAGNSGNAHEILARLNQLSPHGKPLLRSAFYFKEALSALLENAHNQCPVTPWDVVLKLSAYKAFSDVSPVLHFTNFTCVQALIEELEHCHQIHVIDFDIGVGGQWSSFMQELAQRRCTSNAGSSPVSSLKITAFVSPSSHHPLELFLVQENLVHFAGELGIPFQFNVLGVESFELTAHSLSSGGNEVIAVNLPVGSPGSSNPSFLSLVKQLSPKVIVSVDYGYDRSELPFSQHLLHSMHSYSVLLDSIDAANVSLDVAVKIGRFLLQPRIESSVFGRCHSGGNMHTWRTAFASAGFVPMQFSNLTEIQAECLLKRTQTRGFHVEKRQFSLALCWQRGELVSVSAWRC